MALFFGGVAVGVVGLALMAALFVAWMLRGLDSDEALDFGCDPRTDALASGPTE